MSYSIVIIYSNWTINKIYNFFNDYLDANKEEIGMYKIIKYKNKQGQLKDSNKSLFLIKNTLFIRTLEEGLDMEQPKLDFRIADFNLNENHYPRDGYSSNFYIKIPKVLSVEDCEILIDEKMKIFINFDLISYNNYSIKIPLNSRITGEHKEYALLNFENVDLNIIAYIKLLMHDSFLYIQPDQTICNLPVYWCKSKNNNKEIPIYKILKRN